MLKTISLTYDNVSLPSGLSLGSVALNVRRASDNGSVLSLNVDYNTPSVSVDIPSGTWVVELINRDSQGNAIGTPVVSAPFTVVDLVPYRLVTGASV